MTKFLNISTDGTLSGNSDSTVVSEKAIKTYADTKQATISDLATIRSGAALGATAVQPGDLAAVATSGSYNDLSDKPTIPSVGNGTITITQGGVSKGTFTTNQSGNTTIEVDAGAGSPVWGSIGGTLSDQTDLQNALDAKQATITGAATTIASSDLTANRAVISNGSGKVAVSATTSTELGYLSGVTSAVQTQLDSKANSADVYTKPEVDTALSNKANIDMDNLTSTGKNIGNWSSNVTNCITEIPQDIKLELSNGTLTLKAGSVLTDPTGGAQITTTEDKTGTLATNGQYMVFVDKSSGAFQLSSAYTVSATGSGSSLPADGSTYKVFYNTTDKTIYRWNGSSWVSWGVALPLGIITVSGGAISSIDQVFNGLGYIGSTVFALPGVKGLIPDGRNSDGTLKNKTLTNSIVRTSNVSSGRYSVSFVLATSGMNVSTSAANDIYDSVRNVIYNKNTGDVYSDRIIAGYMSVTPGVITSFNPKQVFHALDYSNTEYIAHQTMPSGRFVNLTLGASGSAYTAPADGYVCIRQAILSNGFLQVDVNAISYVNALSINSQATWCIPVRKGVTYTIYYSNMDTAFANAYFRFIYANGSK